MPRALLLLRFEWRSPAYPAGIRDIAQGSNARRRLTPAVADRREALRTDPDLIGS